MQNVFLILKLLKYIFVDFLLIPIKFVMVYSGAGGKRGSNSFLRRPEVLETVYSVEEDQDGDAPVDPTNINERPNSDSGDSTAPNADESPTNSDQEEVTI